MLRHQHRVHAGPGCHACGQNLGHRVDQLRLRGAVFEHQKILHCLALHLMQMPAGQGLRDLVHEAYLSLRIGGDDSVANRSQGDLCQFFFCLQCIVQRKLFSPLGVKRIQHEVESSRQVAHLIAATGQCAHLRLACTHIVSHSGQSGQAARQPVGQQPGQQHAHPNRQHGVEQAAAGDGCQLGGRHALRHTDANPAYVVMLHQHRYDHISQGAAANQELWAGLCVTGKAGCVCQKLATQPRLAMRHNFAAGQHNHDVGNPGVSADGQGQLLQAGQV